MPSSCDKTAAVAETRLISLTAAIVYNSWWPGSYSVVFSEQLWSLKGWESMENEDRFKTLNIRGWQVGCAEIPGLKSERSISNGAKTYCAKGIIKASALIKRMRGLTKFASNDL